MTPEQIDRVFGRGRVKMVTGPHVEVFREPAARGERRRYTKRFLTTEDGDYAPWTEREWRILARLIGHGSRCVPDVVQYDRDLRGTKLVQTYDAGATVDQWATMLPVERDGRAYAHVFEDCAHWWALAHHCLVALDAIHAVGLVHLDVKGDNICVPVGPPGFDVAAQSQRLYPVFPELALIDFAFSLVSGERLAAALPIGWQQDYDYQSPRLLRALEAGRAGDLGPTERLDWRCDMYSIAAMLKRYLPGEYRLYQPSLASGWTEERYEAAKSMILRIREIHDLELPARRPHAELIAETGARLGDAALVRSLDHGWTLALDAQPEAVPTLPLTPVTRLAPPIRLVIPPRDDGAEVDRLLIAPRDDGAHLDAPIRVAGEEDPSKRPAKQTRSNRAGAAGAVIAAVVAAIVVAPFLADAGAWSPDRLRDLADQAGRLARAAVAGLLEPKSTPGTSMAVQASAPPAADAPPAPAAAPVARAPAEEPAPPEVTAAAPTPGHAEVAPMPPPSVRAEAAAMPSPAGAAAAPAASTAAAANVASIAAPVATDRPGPRLRGASRSVPAPSASTVSRGMHSRATDSARQSRPAVGSRFARSAPPVRSSFAPAPKAAASKATEPKTASSGRPARAVLAEKATVSPVGVSGASHPSAAESKTASDAATSSGAASPAPAAAAGAAPGPLAAPMVALVADPATVAGNASKANSATASGNALSAGSGSAAPGLRPATSPPTAIVTHRGRAPVIERSRPLWGSPPQAPRQGIADSVRLQDPPAPVLAQSGRVVLSAAPPPPAVGATPPPPAVGTTPPPVAAPIAKPADAVSVIEAVPARPRPADIRRDDLDPPAPGSLRVRPLPADEQDDDLDSTVETWRPRPAFADARDDDLHRERARRALVDILPGSAAQSRARIARVLRIAADAHEPEQERAIVEAAASLGDASEAAAVSRTHDSNAARRMHERARQAYALRRDLPSALDLGLKAFGADPDDSEIAGHLAFLNLESMPARPELSRQLALHAIGLRNARNRTGRPEDWITFAIASALTGRPRDARDALHVAVALARNADRICRDAVGAYARYGERLREPVEALLYRMHVQGRSAGAPNCAWPPVRVTRYS